MQSPRVDLLQKIDARSKNWRRISNPPTHEAFAYFMEPLSKAPGDQLLYLLLYSSQRVLAGPDPNYLQKKVLPAAQEITDRDVIATAWPRILRNSRRYVSR